MGDPVLIDGSEGEGGGQILRSALALSIVTERPVRLVRVRAGRRRPGLRKQHLTAVRAAAAICGGKLDGDTLGSTEVALWPGHVCAGRYRFSVGTAGSTTLVLQTVLWPLLLADGKSEVHIEGGTHNPMAPPFEFLAQSLGPHLERMGADIEFELLRAGFYPAGGGAITATIGGSARLSPLELLEVGDKRAACAVAIVSNLPSKIGRRELAVVRTRLGWPESATSIDPVDSAGPGNALILRLDRTDGTVVVTSFGEKGKPAERVASEAVDELERIVSAGVPVDPHLADQLLIPMALAGGGSFRTTVPTQHTRTNAEIVQRFLPVKISITDEGEGSWRVDVTGSASVPG